MNSNGFFITFMVFLLVASVLALHEASKKIDFGQERNYIGEAAFNNVNNAFNNVYEEVVSLNKEGSAKEVQQRAMPFEYALKGKEIDLSQRIPPMETTLDAYFDMLNVYSIFVNEQTAESLAVESSTVKNAKWGGSETGVNYVVLPQCLLYSVDYGAPAESRMEFSELGAGSLGCTEGFSYGDWQEVKMKITLDSRDCGEDSGIWGNLAGKDIPPDGMHPYLAITIKETSANCPGTAGDNDCHITQDPSGLETIRTPFDPSDFTEIDSLIVNCGGVDWFRAKIGKESAEDKKPLVVTNWIQDKPINVDANIAFGKKVDLFYFTGFAVSVEKANFPVKRST